MDDIAVLRMLERILAVGIGGMTIYLGYRLFFHLPFERDNQGELTLPGIKIVLSRVGPGVFFAAFGSAVLVYSLVQPVTIKTTDEVDSKPNEQAKFASRTKEFTGIGPLPGRDKNTVSPQQRSSALQAVEMLNCLQLLAKKYPDLADQSVPALREAKRALLLSIWNEDDWGWPEQLSAAGPSESDNTALQNIYRAVYGGCPQ